MTKIASNNKAILIEYTTVKKFSKNEIIATQIKIVTLIIVFFANNFLSSSLSWISLEQTGTIIIIKIVAVVANTISSAPTIWCDKERYMQQIEQMIDTVE